MSSRDYRLDDVQPFDDGGPAFPHREQRDWEGMTLADWFAGQVVAGAAVQPDADQQAADAYRLATALVRAKMQFEDRLNAAYQRKRLEEEPTCADDIPF